MPVALETSDLSPDSPLWNPAVAACVQHALAALRDGQGDAALQALEEARAHAPDAALLWKLTGDVLIRLRRRRDALGAYERAAALDPTDLDAAGNVGALLREAGRPDEAMGWLHRVLAADPGNVSALSNTAQAFVDLGDLPMALATADEALRRAPGYAPAMRARATALFFADRWHDAWAAHEVRDDALELTGGRREIPGERWDGSPLAGRTLLVTVEQGQGDQLQFVRYLRRIPRHGGRVILETYGSLATVMEAAGVADAVVRRGDPLPSYNIHVPIMSLPALLEVGDAFDGDRCPYVAPPGACPTGLRAALDAHWARHGTAPRIGLVWAGSPDQPNDHLRTAPWDVAAELLGIPGIAWTVLQKGPAVAALSTLPRAERERIFVVDAHVHDFGDTAHIVADLDAVISVCTSVAHLAGAMRVPTWLMLSYVPDWRWGLSAETTGWYPSMQIVRQRARGDWHSVRDQLMPVITAWRDARAHDPRAAAPIPRLPA